MTIWESAKYLIGRFEVICGIKKPNAHNPLDVNYIVNKQIFSQNFIDKSDWMISAQTKQLIEIFGSQIAITDNWGYDGGGYFGMYEKRIVINELYCDRMGNRYGHINVPKEDSIMITLAHEIGHFIDSQRNPRDFHQISTWYKLAGIPYVNNPINKVLEVRAWKIAVQEILPMVGIHRLQEWMLADMEYCLRSYGFNGQSLANAVSEITGHDSI